MAPWSPLDKVAAAGAGAILEAEWLPPGTVADTVPDGARVIGRFTGDLLGTSAL